MFLPSFLAFTTTATHVSYPVETRYSTSIRYSCPDIGSLCSNLISETTVVPYTVTLSPTEPAITLPHGDRIWPATITATPSSATTRTITSTTTSTITPAQALHEERRDVNHHYKDAVKWTTTEYTAWVDPGITTAPVRYLYKIPVFPSSQHATAGGPQATLLSILAPIPGGYHWIPAPTPLTIDKEVLTIDLPADSPPPLDTIEIHHYDPERYINTVLDGTYVRVRSTPTPSTRIVPEIVTPPPSLRIVTKTTTPPPFVAPSVAFVWDDPDDDVNAIDGYSWGPNHKISRHPMNETITTSTFDDVVVITTTIDDPPTPVLMTEIPVLTPPPVTYTADNPVARHTKRDSPLKPAVLDTPSTSGASRQKRSMGDLLDMIKSPFTEGGWSWKVKREALRFPKIKWPKPPKVIPPVAPPVPPVTPNIEPEGAAEEESPPNILKDAVQDGLSVVESAVGLGSHKHTSTDKAAEGAAPTGDKGPKKQETAGSTPAVTDKAQTSPPKVQPWTLTIFGTKTSPPKVQTRTLYSSGPTDKAAADSNTQQAPRPTPTPDEPTDYWTGPDIETRTIHLGDPILDTDKFRLLDTAHAWYIVDGVLYNIIDSLDNPSYNKRAQVPVDNGYPTAVVREPVVTGKFERGETPYPVPKPILTPPTAAETHHPPLHDRPLWRRPPHHPHHSPSSLPRPFGAEIEKRDDILDENYSNNMAGKVKEFLAGLEDQFTEVEEPQVEEPQDEEPKDMPDDIEKRGRPSLGTNYMDYTNTPTPTAHSTTKTTSTTPHSLSFTFSGTPGRYVVEDASSTSTGSTHSPAATSAGSGVITLTREQYEEILTSIQREHEEIHQEHEELISFIQKNLHISDVPGATSQPEPTKLAADERSQHPSMAEESQRAKKVWYLDDFPQRPTPNVHTVHHVSMRPMSSGITLHKHPWPRPLKSYPAPSSPASTLLRRTKRAVAENESEAAPEKKTEAVAENNPEAAPSKKTEAVPSNETEAVPDKKTEKEPLYEIPLYYEIACQLIYIACFLLVYWFIIVPCAREIRSWWRRRRAERESGSSVEIRSWWKRRRAERESGSNV